jgi:hypothetical protein
LIPKKARAASPGFLFFESRPMRADGVIGVRGGLAKEGRCT